MVGSGSSFQLVFRFDDAGEDTLPPNERMHLKHPSQKPSYRFFFKYEELRRREL